jgi:hypothetical protein
LCRGGYVHFAHVVPLADLGSRCCLPAYPLGAVNTRARRDMRKIRGLQLQNGITNKQLLLQED